MPASTMLRLGSLDTRLALPPGWQPAHGLVVLLHGFGAPGDDLVQLADYLDVPPTVGFAFPAAPLVLGGMYGDARAWWLIDLARFEQAATTGALTDRMNEIPDGLAAAREALLGMLEALKAHTGVADDRVVLGGFSQGAMLSLDVVLQSDRAFAGVVLMSGTLIASSLWAPRMAARRGMHVMMSHGKSDPLLPFAVAETLRDQLRAAGLDVTWLPFNAGHTIPPAVLTAASALIVQALP